MEISVYEDGTYEGGEYWGTVEVPTDDAEVVDRRTTEVGDHEVDVVEHSEYISVEVWECGCYDD